MQTKGLAGRPRKTKIPIDIRILSVSRWVREKREIIGMTQQQLAQELGLSQALVSRIERGGENISLREVVRILASLGGELSVVPMQYEPIDLSGASGRATEKRGEGS